MRKYTPVFARLTAFFKRYAVEMVTILIVALVIGVAAAQWYRVPEQPVAAEELPPRQVKAIRFGSSVVSEKAVGTVKNLSSITLVAQTSGPVSAIKVKEGQTLKKGAFILSQSSAYGAGSAATVQRQIAAKNYELSQEANKNTSEVVAKNRELADKNRDNTEELRKITERSIDETKSLLTTTEQVITKIDADITAEQAGANNATTIQSLRQSLITYKGVLNSNRSALRSAEYSVNKDNPPTKLADITKDLVYKTTELQLKQAQISQEVAGLNLQLARINEAATRVVAPFAGTLEKMYVNPGQYVTPGTPVAKLKGDANVTLQINVSGEVASRIDGQRSLVGIYQGREFAMPITHISTTPITGQLYEVLAEVPPEYATYLPEEASVEVTLPLYQTTLMDGNYFVPLDAVFVTNTDRFVMVVEQGKAVKKSVKTGQVVGSAIEIREGLDTGAILILDRRVLEGEPVEPHIETLSPVIQELG